jgi:hypothetical protein
MKFIVQHLLYTSGNKFMALVLAAGSLDAKGEPGHVGQQQVVKAP